MEEQYKRNDKLYNALQKERISNRLLSRETNIRESMTSLIIKGQYIPTRKQQQTIVDYLKTFPSLKIKGIGDLFEI